MKRGYRLTPEEEAIVRGEVPGESTPPEEPAPPKGSPKSGTTKSVLLLGGGFVLMILMAKLVFSYFGVFSKNESEEIAVDLRAEQAAILSGSNAVYRLTEEQILSFSAELGLTAEEKAAFWPIYFHFRKETLDWRENHRKHLLEWGFRAADSLSGLTIGKVYSSDLEMYNEVVKSYSREFERILSEKQVALVFLFHESNLPYISAGTP